MTPALEIRPILLASDLRDAGVQQRDVLAAVADGSLLRAGPGVYVTPDVYMDQDLDKAIACHRTGGTIGMLSAAVWHSLCDASPDALMLFVPHHVIRPPNGLPVETIRTRSHDVLSLGVERSDFHGLEIRVTDRARTVCDLYRIAPEGHRQHSVAALATYLRDDGSVERLHEYATAFRVWDVLRPEVEAIQETIERGMRP